MTSDELKALIDLWQDAQRRLNYLQAMRDALPPGQAADALDAQIGKTRAEVEGLQTVILDGGHKP